jgi:hypothetical protein
MQEQQGRGDLHGPAGGVSRCCGRWTRERPCRRCARTVDHSATCRKTWSKVTALCLAACVCMLAASGERYMRLVWDAGRERITPA